MFLWRLMIDECPHEQVTIFKTCTFLPLMAQETGWDVLVISKIT
jgi:hypothetical protein